MNKQKKRILRVSVEIDIPYWEYPTQKLNDKANTFIKKWVRDVVRRDLSHIPLIIEKEEDGSWIDEDTTGRAEFRIRSKQLRPPAKRRKRKYTYLL